LDGNSESEESESEDVQVIDDGINELEITTESQPPTLKSTTNKQSQITAFFYKKINNKINSLSKGIVK